MSNNYFVKFLFKQWKMFIPEKVLEMEPPIPGDESFDLRREAAFNLSLMYKNSGTYDLARNIIDKYIVI